MTWHSFFSTAFLFYFSRQLKNRFLLIPLIRSSSKNNQLETFPLEVIYCLVEEKFPSIGSLTTSLPSIDLLTSKYYGQFIFPMIISIMDLKAVWNKKKT
jgi:hypothetical protein